MHARIIVPAVVAVLALAFMAVAFRYPAMSLQQGFGPGLFPIIVATCIVVLALIEIAVQTIALRQQSHTGRDTGAAVQTVTWRDVGASAFMAAMVIASVLAVHYVGFVPAMAALLTVLSFAMGMRPLWLAALTAVGIAFTIEIVFAKGFGVPLAF